ncbi:MAG: MlaD family protein [Pseudomonadota bacterium]
MLTRAIMIVLILPGLLFGCSSNLGLKVRFEQINGLAKGDAVIFEQIAIGQVKQITYEAPGTFLVSIDLDKEFIPAATEFSHFSISPSPLDPARKAIVMTNEKKGGTPLARGSVVEGEEPAPPVDFKPLMDQIKKGFDSFMDDLAGIPESQQYKAFENKLDELAKDMQTSGKAVQDEIRDTIIPKMKKELEKLRKTLESLGRENEVKPLEKKLEAIREI